MVNLMDVSCRGLGVAGVGVGKALGDLSQECRERDKVLWSGMDQFLSGHCPLDWERKLSHGACVQ